MQRVSDRQIWIEEGKDSPTAEPSWLLTPDFTTADSQSARSLALIRWLAGAVV